MVTPVGIALHLNRIEGEHRRLHVVQRGELSVTADAEARGMKETAGTPHIAVLIALSRQQFLVVRPVQVVQPIGAKRFGLFLLGLFGKPLLEHEGEVVLQPRGKMRQNVLLLKR